jgi:paraquat-inducible protein B
MERIVLEVDGRTANAWRNSSPVFKSRMEQEIKVQISRRLKELQRAEFKRIVNDVRDEAAANGFTEEILEQILHDEEQVYF